MSKTQLKQKLQHPFALIAQGFVAGVILFWVTAPSEGNAQSNPSVAAESQVAR